MFKKVFKKIKNSKFGKTMAKVGKVVGKVSTTVLASSIAGPFGVKIANKLNKKVGKAIKEKSTKIKAKQKQKTSQTAIINEASAINSSLEEAKIIDSDEKIESSIKAGVNSDEVSALTVDNAVNALNYESSEVDLKQPKKPNIMIVGLAAAAIGVYFLTKKKGK